MVDSPSTSMSLLMRAKNGSEEAWSRILEIYTPVVYRQCQRRGLSEEDARDVTQEIFLAVAKGLEGFRRDREGDSFLRWMRTIASKKIVDRLRKLNEAVSGQGGSSAQVRLSQLPDMETEWNPDEMRRHAYHRALKLMQTNFQERTWQAFWLCVVEEQTTAEVCETLDMKPSAVRNARHKVRRCLVGELGDLLDLS